MACSLRVAGFPPPRRRELITTKARRAWGGQWPQPRRTSNIERRMGKRMLWASLWPVDQTLAVSFLPGSCTENEQLAGSSTKKTKKGMLRAAPGISGPCAGLCLPSLSSLRITIAKLLVFPARNPEMAGRNMRRSKPMRTVFHSMFDVGRSMFDVRSLWLRPTAALCSSCLRGESCFL